MHSVLLLKLGQKKVRVLSMLRQVRRDKETSQSTDCMCIEQGEGEQKKGLREGKRVLKHMNAFFKSMKVWPQDWEVLSQDCSACVSPAWTAGLGTSWSTLALVPLAHLKLGLILRHHILNLTSSSLTSQLLRPITLGL